MLNHDEVAEFLAAEFPALRVVARWADPELRLPPARARIFVPDLHLLAESDAAQYPTTRFKLRNELRRFLAALVRFKNDHPGELEVLHLGDLFDLWRARGPGTVKEKVDAIVADYRDEVAALFRGPPVGVRAGLVAGNHDYDLHYLAEWNALRFAFLNDSPAGQPDALALHGDQFDFVERIVPHPLRAAMVRLFRQTASAGHELDQEQAADVLALNDQLPRGDQVAGTGLTDLAPPDGLAAGSTNVIHWSPQVGRIGRFFEPARQLAVALKGRGRDIRLVICGHSHHARIVVGDRGDGVTMALVDCGAWLGQCRFGPGSPWRPSAQLGVLVGNDARIYQLGAGSD